MRHGYHVEEPDLGSELDADGSAFSVLDTERTNDGICMCFQTTHFQTLVNANANGRLAWECRCGSSRHTRLLSRLTGRTRAVEVSPRTKGPREPSTLQCAYPSAERMPSGPGSPRGAHVRSVNNHHARHRPRCAERVCSITPSAKTSPRSVLRLPIPRTPTLPAPVSPINAVKFLGAT